jgi:LexA DNA binding domain
MLRTDAGANLWYRCLLVQIHQAHRIDPMNVFSETSRPFALIPAWWSSFLLQVLTPRQLSLYVYLSLLSAESGICHPTTQQIRKELGLSSMTIVFDALSALEQKGFILRKRRHIEELNSRRNIYQRPACAFTILRLLENSNIDGCLQPAAIVDSETSDESRSLKDAWLRESLGSEFANYDRADNKEKREILIDFLKADIAGGSTDSQLRAS